MPTPAPSATARPLHAAAVTVRLAALWILLGAGVKLLLATPADLPGPVRDLALGSGLGLATAWRAALGLEAAVGLLALLSPRRGWLPLVLLLGAFLAVLALQVAAGADSCGCFGGKIKVPPWIMLGVDAVFLGLVLASRPWTLVGRPLLPVLVLAPLLAGALVLPWLLDREAKGPGAGKDAYVVLALERWPGMKTDETELAAWVDLSRLPASGLWVFYRNSCELCAEHLEILALREMGERPVALIRLPDEEEGPPKVHVTPEGDWVTRIALPSPPDWVLTVPAEAVVERGRVVSTRQAIQPGE